MRTGSWPLQLSRCSIAFVVSLRAAASASSLKSLCRDRKVCCTRHDVKPSTCCAQETSRRVTVTKSRPVIYMKHVFVLKFWTFLDIYDILWRTDAFRTEEELLCSDTPDLLGSDGVLRQKDEVAVSEQMSVSEASANFCVSNEELQASKHMNR